MEATIDPARTLGRDIFPRFQKTSKYTKMNTMLEDLQINNKPEDLIVPFPSLPKTPLPIDDPNYQYSLEVPTPSSLSLYLYPFLQLSAFASSSLLFPPLPSSSLLLLPSLLTPFLSSLLLLLVSLSLRKHYPIRFYMNSS
jgi:hypothetical protein